MSDFKDFHEDNKESFGRYLDSLTERGGYRLMPHIGSFCEEQCRGRGFVSPVLSRSHTSRMNHPRKIQTSESGVVVATLSSSYARARLGASRGGF
jgi:hypothetical protein